MFKKMGFDVQFSKKTFDRLVSSFGIAPSTANSDLQLRGYGTGKVFVSTPLEVATGQQLRTDKVLM